MENLIKKGKILYNEPMSKHTTFRTGGPAKVMVMPGDEEELAAALKYCKENGLKFYIIGNGSNLLVSDNGLDGVVIKIDAGFSRIKVNGYDIEAGAGVMLSRLAAEAAANELEGLEFAAGIPGSLGGAITMNAGAYGGEMKDIVISVTMMDYDGRVKSYTPEEMNFGYRHSKVSEGGYIVLKCTLRLKKGNEEDIRARMRELAYQRKSKQPLEYPSAGSTFKRPEGYFAGKLIMDAGLRGYTHGGAQVSEKHCGFIINAGNSTTKDILELIEIVRDKVYKDTGVALEPEVRYME